LFEVLILITYAATASSAACPPKIPAGHPYANYTEYSRNKKLRKALVEAAEEEEKKKREEAFYNYHNVM
jgi:hypothetical protein